MGLKNDLTCVPFTRRQLTLRLVLTAIVFTLPAAAFAQEALYKSYMEAAGNALQAGEWKEVEKKVAEATKREARAADLKVKMDKSREALPK